MTLLPVLLQEQPAVVLLLEKVLVSWSSAIDERSEHEDLRVSGRRSVIPYVHERIELYCSSLALPEPFLSFRPLNLLPIQSFYSLRSSSYIETQSPTGGPEVVEILYNI
jgi:hypothetical protein